MRIVHATDAEITRAAAGGASIASCPSSNAALGSGIFPLRKHFDAGARCALGTDGFGRGDNRPHLRAHFEVDAASIAAAALSKLARDGKFDPQKAARAIEELGVNSEKIDSAVA